MPLYEYKCDQCGQVFEILQKFSDTPLKIHPECGGTVGRLMSSPSFKFKGTGWYVTDYGPKNGNGSRTGENGNGKGTGENGGKKPETSSKPAESKPSTSSDTASHKN